MSHFGFLFSYFYLIRRSAVFFYHKPNKSVCLFLFSIIDREFSNN